MVSVGRLVFDTDHSVSGISSTDFTGLYLGNPVRGMYQVSADCSISWSLQDDSGHDQQFRGTVSSDGRRVQFQQTDPGSPHRGVMLQAAESCRESDFQSSYHMAISGKLVDVATAQTSGDLSLDGSIERRGSGLSITAGGATTTGSVEVDDDCFVHLNLKLPQENGGAREMNFRGMLVDGGKQVLGMATDPGTAVSLRLDAR